MPFSRDMPMSRLSDNTDPFLQMRREMNRLFDDAFGGFGLPSAFGSALRQMPAAPKIDVSERDNEIQIEAEMPGIDQNDVEVLLEDDRLIIRGEKEEERDARCRRSLSETTRPARNGQRKPVGCFCASAACTRRNGQRKRACSATAAVISSPVPICLKNAKRPENWILDPCRTSPAANTPGSLVSISQSSVAPQRSEKELGRSPTSTRCHTL
jgi:HSP20 family molecular chaperone IbpA